MWIKTAVRMWIKTAVLMWIKTAVLMWVKTEGRKVIRGGESGEGTEVTGMNEEGARGDDLSADKKMKIHN